MRPRYGVDQSDRARLHQIVADDLGGEPIDVVFDDCSHLLDLTSASFDALFPFVRPGGIYVIEDWNLDLVFREAFAGALRDEGSPENAELAEAIRQSLRDRATLASPPPPPKPPLARLALELSLACATANDVIAGVAVDEHWITVRRGPAEVSADTFTLEGLYVDHFNLLSPSGDARIGAGLDVVPLGRRHCADGRLACRLGSFGLTAPPALPRIGTWSPR